MSRSRLVIDRRWACLCSRRNLLSLPPRPYRFTQPISTTRFASTSSREDQGIYGQQSIGLKPLQEVSKGTHHVLNTSREIEKKGNGLPSTAALSRPAKASVQSDGVERLEEKLRLFAQRSSQNPQLLDLTVINDILAELIGKHMRKPTPEYYRIWILAHCDPVRGSIGSLRLAWEEIVEHNIAVGSEVYHAFIKALSYHPDYLLRTSILDRMRLRWISLTQDGWNDLVVGLLKDNQLALATEKMQEMTRLGMTLYLWVHLSLVHCLIQNAEYADAFDTLRKVVQRPDGQVSLNSYYQLLESASRDYDHEVTSLTWETMVEPGYLTPSFGVCRNVLVTATRANDQKLAARVFEHLANNKGNMSLEICEPLLEIYAASNDIQAAFRLIRAMKGNNLDVSEATLRPVIDYYDRHPVTSFNDPLVDLELMIKQETDSIHQTPIELINALMEIRVRSKDFKGAKHIFDRRLSLSSMQPNLRTYSLLFLACQQLHDFGSAMNYFDSLQRSSPSFVPDERMCTALIDLCLRAREYVLASRFLLAAQDDGVVIQSKTLEYWRQFLNEIDQTSLDESLENFKIKLTHALEGGKLRKDIAVLSQASEAFTFGAAQDNAKKTERIRKAKTGYALRQLHRSEDNSKTYATRKTQEEHEYNDSKEHIYEDIDKFLDASRSSGMTSREWSTNSPKLSRGLNSDTNRMYGDTVGEKASESQASQQAILQGAKRGGTFLSSWETASERHKIRMSKFIGRSTHNAWINEGPPSNRRTPVSPTVGRASKTNKSTIPSFRKLQAALEYKRLRKIAELRKDRRQSPQQ